MKNLENNNSDIKPLSKTESFLMILGLAFIIANYDTLIDHVQFSMEEHLIKECGGICERTNNTITTIVEYNDPDSIFNIKQTEALTHEGPIDVSNEYFPHGCSRNIVLEQTRHEYAFKKTGNILGLESLDSGQDVFNISYPGIGSHVAFLSMLKEMISANQNIKSINVYTPELMQGYRVIDSFLLYLDETGYLSDYQYDSFELENTTEVFMKFKLGSSSVNIHYHVDEDRERFVYSNETNFDLIVLHDLGSRSTDQFISDLNDVLVHDVRILGPKKATLTNGFKFDNIMHIGGAFHCEHSCQNDIFRIVLKNGTYSAVLFDTTPIAK